MPPRRKNLHPAPHTSGHQEIIGWKESIDLPDWGIAGLLAKSDTGAKTSAIDVSNIRRLKNRRVAFDVILHRTRREEKKRIIAAIAGETNIRSSNGIEQSRIKVRTTLKIGPLQREAEFTLVSRERMICRVLLGRAALEGSFLVDSRRTFLFGPHPGNRAAQPHRIRGAEVGTSSRARRP
jgi:hypothetical protein